MRGQGRTSNVKTQLTNGGPWGVTQAAVRLSSPTRGSSEDQKWSVLVDGVRSRLEEHS